MKMIRWHAVMMGLALFLLALLVFLVVERWEYNSRRSKEKERPVS